MAGLKKEQENHILNSLLDGISLNKIVIRGQKPGAKIKLPTYPTVVNYFNSDPERRQKYETAKMAGLERMGDSIIEFAESPVLDKLELNHRRLIVDTKKWILSKMLPKKFGDSVDLNVGGQQDNPIEIQIKFGNDD